MLRYLPTNLSRPETASELSVSVNTVSTHIRNIHAKLQAGPGSLLGSTARGRAAAATGGSQSLGPGSPDPGDAVSPARDRLWLHGHGISPASIRINGHPGATLLSAFPAMVSEKQGVPNRSHRPAGPVGYTGCWPRSRRSAWTSSRCASSHPNANRESPQPGDNRSPQCNLTSGPTNPCDDGQRCTEPRAWKSRSRADESRW